MFKDDVDLDFIAGLLFPYVKIDKVAEFKDVLQWTKDRAVDEHDPEWTEADKISELFFQLSA